MSFSAYLSSTISSLASWSLTTTPPTHTAQESVVFRKPVRLDIELYRYIIAYMDDQPDIPTWELRLHNLLFVSRAWRAEAERYIYTYVAVPEGRALRFFDTLSRRPDLAKLVRELQFYAFAMRSPREGDFDIIERGLKSLIALRDLTMWTGGEVDGFMPEYIVTREDTRILRGPFPFKLYRFATDLVWSEEQRDFLVEQDELRILRTSGPLQLNQRRWKMPSTALPHLRCLYSFPGFLRDFDSASPLQLSHAHLATYAHDAAEEARGAADLVQHSNFLRVLVISRNSSPDDIPCLSPAALLSRFIACNQLTFFGLYDTEQYWTPRDRAQVLRIVTENFPVLKVFAFASLHSIPQQRDDWESSEDGEYLTDSDGEVSGADRMLKYASDLITRHKTRSLVGVLVCGEKRANQVTAYWQDETETFVPVALTVGTWDCYEFLDPDDVFGFLVGEGPDVGRFEDPEKREDSLWRPSYDHFLRHACCIAIVLSHPVLHMKEKRTWRGVQTANFDEDSDSEESTCDLWSYVKKEYEF